tara:strand:- start:28 stop:291 length:264 start_codon:yes stop_codon:yes gene_type:complete
MSGEIINDGKGKFQIINESKITRNEGVIYIVEKKIWLNCVRCGNKVNDRSYHFCYKCFLEWEENNRKKIMAEDTPTYCMIDTDSDED